MLGCGWTELPCCCRVCTPAHAAADPTAPEVLQADRLVAAAARKAVAMHRAVEASKALQALPAPAHGGAEQPKQHSTA